MANIDKKLIEWLEAKALQIRKDICITTSKIGYSHIGGGLSMTDMVVALYYHFLNFDPKNPKDPDRDRFVLSKGHCAHVLYNVFVDLGMYKKEDLYNEYNKIGGRFGMHPNRLYVNGIEASTGSLGHGASIAVGMALAARIDKKNHRIICMTGDGELDAGTNWEAFMCAGHYQLGNLIHIVDHNHLQINGTTDEIMTLEPLDDKFRAFGWDVITIDGNNMEEVVQTFSAMPKADSQIKRKPLCIIANTIKSKGISFAENNPDWHIGIMSGDILDGALQSIEATAKVRG